jgi:DNA modification methylase
MVKISKQIPLNTLLTGNNIEILKTFPDECIDLTVTSPPYDKLRDYQGYSFNFDVFKKLAAELYRVTKTGGMIVWVIGDATFKGSETGSSFKQALYFKEEVGFKLHDTMIYQKSAFANPSKTRYHQIFEYMFIFSKGKLKTFNPIKDKPNKTQYDFGRKRRKKDGTMTNTDDMTRIKVAPFGMRFNIWRYVTGRGNTTKDSIAFNHPAVFPEKLANDHIISWSNEGDVILDPMNGAGTTSKMALLNNRKFIGIDISEEYGKIAFERLKIAKELLQSENKICPDFYLK